MSYKIFENRDLKLKVGDLVMITYRDSRYYKHIGTIMRINEIEDMDVRLEYEDLVVRFYKTNLLKVDQIVEVPTGEVVTVSYEHRVYLSAVGVAQYDFDRQCYAFRADDRWQVSGFQI